MAPLIFNKVSTKPAYKPLSYYINGLKNFYRGEGIEVDDYNSLQNSVLITAVRLSNNVRGNRAESYTSKVAEYEYLMDGVVISFDHINGVMRGVISRSQESKMSWFRITLKDGSILKGNSLELISKSGIAISSMRSHPHFNGNTMCVNGEWLVQLGRLAFLENWSTFKTVLEMALTTYTPHDTYDRFPHESEYVLKRMEKYCSESNSELDPFREKLKNHFGHDQFLKALRSPVSAYNIDSDSETNELYSDVFIDTDDFTFVRR